MKNPHRNLVIKGIKIEEEIMLIHLLIHLSWLTLAGAALEAKAGCQVQCGKVIVPYPFGIGIGCSIGKWYKLICNTSFNPPKPFILGNLEVLHISDTSLRTKNWVVSKCYNQSGGVTSRFSSRIDLINTTYTFSHTENMITAIGCGTMALITGSDGQGGCISSCDVEESLIIAQCGSNGCCQNSIPKGLKTFSASLERTNNRSKTRSSNPCSYAFLAEQSLDTFTAYDLSDPNFINIISDVPMVLEWVIGNETCQEAQRNKTSFACRQNSECYNSDNGPEYRCRCLEGFKCNPFLDPGCLGMPSLPTLKILNYWEGIL